MTITAVVLGGLAWFAEETAGSIVGETASTVSANTLRGLRERWERLSERDAEELARGLRAAQLRALERVIQDYRKSEHPEWVRDPHLRPDIFFDRSLSFCTRALHGVRDKSLHPISGIADPLGDAINDLFVTPRGAGTVAEDAVLRELEEALHGVVLPPGFVEHFRHGTSDKPRFLTWFGAYIVQEIKLNVSFFRLLIIRQLVRVETLASDSQSLMLRMERHFGVASGQTGEKLDSLTNQLEEISSVQNQHGDQLAQILNKISVEKGVPAAPLRAILAKLGEANVPDDEIAHRLAAKAEEYLELREHWSELEQGRPDLASVRGDALERINGGDLDGAQMLLANARMRIRQARDDFSRDEAALLVDEGEVYRLALRYLMAADKYGEAGKLVGPFDPDSRFGFLVKEGAVLYDQGVEFGDNDALRRATIVWQCAVELRPRESYPLEWANVQNHLGSALAVLGDRESGTSNLEQAVAAFRAASQEVSLEREPIDWVRCQNNLANALLGLADRTDSIDLVHDAIAAYEAALKVLPRKREPFKWGMVHNNRGIAFLTLARRENRPEFLAEAAAAFQTALEEWTRERDSLHWATATGNLGNALAGIGVEENDPQRLDQAIAEYIAILEVSTRERVPLEWALTQHNLAIAVSARAKYEGGTTSLEQAVGHFRAALEEWTRERAAFDWAIAHSNLGDTLAELGTRENSAWRLSEAVTAYEGAIEVFEESKAEYYLNGTRTKLADVLKLLSALGSLST